MYANMCMCEFMCDGGGEGGVVAKSEAVRIEDHKIPCDQRGRGGHICALHKFHICQ